MKCLFGFQRQLYRLDFAASKAQRKRSPDGYRHDVQPSLVRGPFDSSAVHSCFLPAFEPDRLRNAESGEQISWNEQRVDLGEGDQRSGIAYDDSHAETSPVSLSVVSSRRTISMPRLPRCATNSLKESPLIFAALPSDTPPPL